MIKLSGMTTAQKPFFRAELQSDGVFEMAIYEYIGEDFWTGGGITAKTVKQQLDAAGSFSSISLRINSPGGDVFEGIAIGNLLKATGKPINVAIDGIAASAASVIAMCGGSIEMASNAMMMIHNAWTMCVGDTHAMQKMAASLAKVDGAIAQTYVDRTKCTMDEVRAMMDAETWLTAEDCVEKGFCTGLAAEADEPTMAMATKFRNMWNSRKLASKNKDDIDLDCQCSCKNCAAGTCSDCMNASCEDENCKDCPMQQTSSASQPVPVENASGPAPSSDESEMKRASLDARDRRRKLAAI